MAPRNIHVDVQGGVARISGNPDAILAIAHHLRIASIRYEGDANTFSLMASYGATGDRTFVDGNRRIAAEFRRQHDEANAMADAIANAVG